MRIRSAPFVVLFFALATAPVAAQVTPEALAKLEARRQAKPNDVGALRALGIALFKMKRYSEAETVLTEARRLAPKDAVVALYLGMSAEERNELPKAREAYTAYLATGRTRSAKDAVTARLAVVTQKELAASAKAAVAQEQRLAGQRGPATTIAVLPFSVTGNDTYAPLGRGIAELMIADLGQFSGQLTLLERARVQAMLDEIALGRSGNVDQATVVRSGRLLQAGNLVSGSLNVASTQNVVMTANVISVETSRPQTVPSQNGSLDQLFDTEKRLVLQTVRALGITPTAAQERAVNGNRPTRNIQAFLAYSRGLASFDAGRLSEAATFFDNARALDPAFGMATQKATEARAGQTGQTVTTAQIEGTLRGSAEGQVVAAAERGNVGGGSSSDGIGSTLQNALADVNPSTADLIGRVSTSVSTRDATSSTTGNDLSTLKTGTLTIVVKKP